MQKKFAEMEFQREGFGLKFECKHINNILMIMPIEKRNKLCFPVPRVLLSWTVWDKIPGQDI